MLVSPAEPAAFKHLGQSSLKTEEYGVDFLFATRVGLVGVQRKEYNDLLASVQQGDRLYRELKQMKQLDVGIFLIEGQPLWTPDGNLLGRQQWTIRQHLGMMLSIQSRGYWILQAAGVLESIALLSILPKWFEKESHNSLETRPKPDSSWGFRTDKDWGCHLLQSFAGVGPQTAANIYNQHGLPLKWTVTEEELVKVPGVGKKRARRLMEALGE